jgi:hypothetical protein
MDTEEEDIILTTTPRHRIAAGGRSAAWRTL